MPISRLQSEVLSLLAAQRDAEGFVAGGVPINRQGPRFSGDIDIFHDREDRVVIAANKDTDILAKSGYQIAWIRRFPAFHSASVSKNGEGTKLEWVADSDFRYFPPRVSGIRSLMNAAEH